MLDPEQLAVIVEDLIVVLQRQAKELEKMIAHVEQITTHLPESSQIAMIASELSSLHVHIRKLISPLGTLGAAYCVRGSPFLVCIFLKKLVLIYHPSRWHPSVCSDNRHRSSKRF